MILRFLLALLLATASASAANFPYIRLNAQTNRLSDNAVSPTFNNVALTLQTDFDGAYFKTNALPISLVGTLTNWAKLSTNVFAPLASPALTGTPTINGQSIEMELTNKVDKTIATAPTLTGTLIAPEVVTPPVTITQDNTNVVINFAVGSWQLLTATNDLHFIASNIVAGASILVDVTAGTDNRNLTFDLGTNWMSVRPVTLSGNHIFWLSILATGTTTNSLRPSSVQSYP